MKIAIFGGTGDLGRGLAITFAAAGHEIIVGSRSQERADQAAEGLREAYPEGTFVPMENAEAAAAGEMAVLSIPFEGIEATMPALAEPLAGKVLVSVVNALKFGKSGAMAVLDLPAVRRVARLDGGAHLLAHDRGVVGVDEASGVLRGGEAVRYTGRCARGDDVLAALRRHMRRHVSLRFGEIELHRGTGGQGAHARGGCLGMSPCRPQI